jgi:hypothetical protein
MSAASASAQGSDAGQVTSPPAIVITAPPDGATAEVEAPAAHQPWVTEDASIKDLNRRVRLARIGLGLSAGVGIPVGVALAMVGTGDCLPDPAGPQAGAEDCSSRGLQVAGLVVFSVATAGTIASAVLLGIRKKQRRQRQRELQMPAQRKIRWDLASSRVVF